MHIYNRPLRGCDASTHLAIWARPQRPKSLFHLFQLSGFEGTEPGCLNTMYTCHLSGSEGTEPGCLDTIYKCHSSDSEGTEPGCLDTVYSRHLSSSEGTEPGCLNTMYTCHLSGAEGTEPGCLDTMYTCHLSGGELNASVHGRERPCSANTEWLLRDWARLDDRENLVRWYQQSWACKSGKSIPLNPLRLGYSTLYA